MNMRRKRFNKVWLWTSIASLAMAIALWRSGASADCKPGQIDGQCGLSTFIGILYGFLLVIAVNVVMGIVALVLTFWWNRHPVNDEADAT